MDDGVQVGIHAELDLLKSMIMVVAVGNLQVIIYGGLNYHAGC